jgi:hypothetical protein
VTAITTTTSSTTTKDKMQPSTSSLSCDESKVDLKLIVCQSWTAGLMCGIFTTLLAIQWLKQLRGFGGALALPFHP